jgi:hypothetical protein
MHHLDEHVHYPRRGSGLLRVQVVAFEKLLHVFFDFLKNFGRLFLRALRSYPDAA